MKYKPYDPDRVRETRRQGNTGAVFGCRGLLVLALCGIVTALVGCDSGSESATAAPAAQTPASSAQPAPAAAAEDADGTITATFNGTERTWYVTSMERGGRHISQSDWSPMFASQAEVSLFGHVSPTSQRSNEALMLSFTLNGSGTSATAMEPSITYLSEGLLNNHSSEHDGGEAVVTVENARIDGPILEISGTFSGTLPFRSMNQSVDPSTRESIVVENGRFDASVRQLEDE